MLLFKIQILRENILQNLYHADRATIIYRFLVFSNILRKNMLDKELLNTFKGLFASVWFIQGINEILSKTLCHMSEHRSMEANSQCLWGFTRQ